MAMRDKLHGVDHLYQKIDKPIEVVSASVISLTATADDADNTKFPLNKPVLVNKVSLTSPRPAPPARCATR